MTLSRLDLARALDCDPSLVYRWARRGMPTHDIQAAMRWRAENVKSNGRRGGYLKAKAVFVPPSVPAAGGKLTWRARRERADALKAETAAQVAAEALARSRGELVEVSRLALILSDVARQWANICEAIPVRLRRHFPDLPPATIKLIEAELDRARNLVADLMVTDGLE